MSPILEVLPVHIAVSQYVREQEVKSYDLSPHIQSGQITQVSEQGEAEEQDVVNFSASLGSDGEAMTGAIAVARDWAIATDETRVLQFFGRSYPHLQLITTPEIMKFWVDATSPPAPVVRQALTRIHEYGRYKISRAHRLYLWWQACL